MNDNQLLITRFYTALQKGDYRTMQDCYHDDAVFLDPVFEDLNAAEVRAMWEMLCKSARDFKVSFSDVVSEDEYATCRWIANYTFSQTGRKVTNNVKAYFKIQEGKIIGHTDDFNLWRWSRQALGLPGWLLGWNNILQKKVRARAQDKLAAFMHRSEVQQ